MLSLVTGQVHKKFVRTLCRWREVAAEASYIRVTLRRGVLRMLEMKQAGFLPCLFLPCALLPVRLTPLFLR